MGPGPDPGPKFVPGPDPGTNSGPGSGPGPIHFILYMMIFSIV